TYFRKSRGAEMLKTGLFCDICILVEDVKFPCHRFMLARASEFFEKMFQKDGIDTGEVRLEDTTSKVFQIILNFIYTEKTELLTGLDYTTLVKVLQKANMWLISEVEKICTDLLRKKAEKMKPEILVEMFAIFYLLNNKSFLIEIIKLLEQQSVSDVTSLKVFTLGFDCFNEFVRSTSHIFPDSKRFAMVESWILKNEDFQYSSLGEHQSMLSTINFKNMTIQEFRHGPGKSKLLADIDKYEIMSEIAIKSTNKFS
ncbi:hypothetical protein KR074_000723, partial [Drosophila pseudoananassae]